MSEAAHHLQVVRHWAALSLGDSHAAGVSTDAECYTWGCNDLGQLGYMGDSKQLPTKMDILRGWDVKAIACGCATPPAASSGPCCCPWAARYAISRSVMRV